MKRLTAFFLFISNAYGTIFIDSLPYTCDNADETYVINKNLIRDSGAVIRIESDNIKMRT